MPLPRAFFDFTVADAPLGRVVFELYSDVVPKTAENFRALCTGEVKAAHPLHYKGSPVHRVIEGFMIQGGDFTKRNGTGGESIYGGMFKDERLEGEGTEVDREGLLVMANRGPDTNGSQWFITLAAAPHLTGKHVVFGRVIHGMEHIKTIGALPTDGKDRPLSPVIIAHCGELELRKQAVPASPSPSEDSEDERERERRARRRERRERKEREREERRAERKERKGSRSRSASPRRDRDRDRRARSLSETLSELDARLEREEKERLEAERLEQLQKIKADLEAERQAVKDAGGVIYKGRGTMRYRDPESRPSNYSSRRPEWRGSGDRWSRGDRDDRRGGRDRDFGRDRDRDRIGRGGRDFDKWEHDGGRRRAPEFAAASGEGNLASRISDLPYDDEQRQIDVAREKERDGGDSGRAARAGAWAQARKPSPATAPSPDRARDKSAESDMALDYGSD